MLPLLKTIWKQIEKVLKFIGKIQSAILLTVFYVTILGLMAILFQLSKFFRRQERVRSFWKERPLVEETEVTLLRQF